MSYFKYSGYGADGAAVSDTVEAGSPDEALSQLQAQGVFVVELAQASSRGAAGGGRGKDRVNVRDVVVFTRLLATMVNADIPLVDGLEMTLEQIPEGRLRQVVRRVVLDIKSGLSLSEALEMHPQVFNRLYVSMVRAGEMSGKLGGILEQLFAFLERMDTLRRKILSALIYPAIILTLAVAIVTLFMLVFIPQFKDNFGQLGAALPSITRFLIGSSDFFRDFFPFLAAGAVGGTLFLLRWFKTPAGKRWYDRTRFRLPVIGPLAQKVVLVRVTRTLGTLLGSGVPIIDALAIVGAASGNVLMEELLQTTRKRIADGERMAKILGTSPLMPKMILQMVAMGEETGHLPSMLEKAAQFYDADVDVAVERLTAAITPVLIIGLGLFVGLVVVALFLPMFSMSQMVG